METPLRVLVIEDNERVARSLLIVAAPAGRRAPAVLAGPMATRGRHGRRVFDHSQLTAVLWVSSSWHASMPGPPSI
jgi:hypothetical protein